MDCTVTARRRGRNQSAPGLTDAIPYVAMLTPEVVATSAGDLVTTFRLAGCNDETADDRLVNDWHERLNLLWRTLADSSLALWVHLVRMPIEKLPTAEPGSGFAGRMRRAYASRLDSSAMRSNRWYLTLVYRPPSIGPSTLLRPAAMQASQEMLADQLATLSRSADQVVEGLQRYDIERLSLRQEGGRTYSEQLEFLSLLINGEETKVRLPTTPLHRALAVNRPVFGVDCMEYRAAATRRLGAFLGIKEYPGATHPGVLNALLQSSSSFILSQSFTYLPKPVAQGLFQNQLKRMHSAGDLAVSQAAALRQALDELASNRFVTGDHHFSLQLLSQPQALTESPLGLQRSLEEAIAATRIALGNAGIISAREDLALESAYRAQLPANFTDRTRRAPITSRNFAGLASFHGQPAGRATGNHWGNALAVLKTNGGGPYYMSLHASDPSAPDGGGRRDTGHTFICGPTGSGKSVLVGFFITLLSQQDVTQIVIDKDHGLEILVTGLGGEYRSLEIGVPTGLNPLRLESSPENVDFLRRWLARLVEGQLPLSPAQQADLHQALSGTLALAPESRRLSRLLEFLDPTDPVGPRARLCRWCTSSGGDLGWVFDNDFDAIQPLIDSHALVGFDVTGLLRIADVRASVAQYLFHLVRRLIDGRRLVMWTDEFSTILDDDAFSAFAKDGLKTWRKLNAVAAFATQSPSDVLSSPIARTLIEQTPTKIFLPNPDADYAEYTDGMGLTPREYDIVRNTIAPGSRRFLLKQGSASVVCELDLRGLTEELRVISGRTGNIVRARILREELGAEPEHWLPTFLSEGA